ncbi:M14 family metallopeptidase [Sphaerisporangium corydalis]|uniref:M14 family metallopeptidase n=1 Tax=Sphaerisporangium corydalis TaxID=1441875 RepID=A0ABV9EPH4_9ACTN|nr:M14 family metallopeptidase [Sphaerisporangium corydalis]
MSQPSPRTQTYFAQSYPDARSNFLDAARQAGAEISSFRNDHGSDPSGADLYTDVAWIAPSASGPIVTLVSGTHGIEGFCGSACQVGFLREELFAEAPEGTGLLLVHALNPYGFAHERRVNEDNVDLNRNFVDHSDPPRNPVYDTLHEALVPAVWGGREQRAADRSLGKIAGEHGLRYVQEAVTGGQYLHPDGLFYGGTEPVWSHRLLRSIARDFLAGDRRIAYIDLHTGLGPRGYGEPIFRGGRDQDALARARSWYGPALTQSENGTSSSTPIIGNTASSIADELDADQQLTAITLEFGTLPGIAVLDALRADNWLYLQSEPEAGHVKEIKQAIREAFYPPDPEWREAVWTRAQEVFRQAFAGLAKG